MPLAQKQIGLGPRTTVVGVRPAKLLDMEYRTERGETKHQLVLQTGEGQGERAFFMFPEKLGTSLEIWPLSAGVGQQLADLLDEGKK